jgi:two-component system, LuxR family, sensor kinase FixL
VRAGWRILFQFSHFTRAIIVRTLLAKELALARGDETRTDATPAKQAVPTFANYLQISVIYLAIYFLLNILTDARQFRESGITLWSPDNGLSLLLLMESISFAPIVLFGSIISDVYISHVSHNLAFVTNIDLLLVLSYSIIAAVLRDGFQFTYKSSTHENIVILAIVIAISAAATAILVSGALYLMNVLPGGQVYTAAYDFWIGDTVGIMVVFPAATAVYDMAARSSWRQFGSRRNVFIVLVVGLAIAVLGFVSAGNARNHHLFYLLFLPTIWVGISYGYAAVAVALLATQGVLIVAMTYFGVEDNDFSMFQTMMFVLSVTGLLLGAVVSERERATRLLRAQQLELARIATQAVTGAMAMTLAHEISQPLSSLSTYVHSARRMLGGGQSTSSVLHALEKAEAEAKRTQSIMERIRDFVSNGKLALESVDLNQVARKIQLLNLDDARTKRVGLEVETLAPLPPVRADKIAVEQALNNLVVNAIDAASQRKDSGGRVILRLARRNDAVVIQVDDNGPGVAPEIADSLFEAFETTKTTGMGLGLTLTHQIARRHSGTLGWRNLEPEGASFSIELPIHGPDENAG